MTSKNHNQALWITFTNDDDDDNDDNDNDDDDATRVFCCISTHKVDCGMLSLEHGWDTQVPTNAITQHNLNF